MVNNFMKGWPLTLVIGSDVQGLGKPPGVKGKGQEGKGQGKDFITFNKPLPFSRVRGFPGVLFTRYKSVLELWYVWKLSLNVV